MYNVQKETPEQSFNHLKAIGIAEGFIEEKDETKVIAAWQHLVDTGLFRSLGGYFTIKATYMIKKGLLNHVTSK